MKYRIEKHLAFTLTGYKIRTTNQWMKGRFACPRFWRKTLVSKKHEILLPLIKQPPFGLIGASVYNVDKQDSRKFDYYIAISSALSVYGDLDTFEVPAMTWAIFPCTRQTSHRTQINIVKKWIPNSPYMLLNTGYQGGFMHSSAPDLEVYTEGDTMEIWVPVQLKEGE